MHGAQRDLSWFVCMLLHLLLALLFLGLLNNLTDGEITLKKNQEMIVRVSHEDSAP